MSCIFSVMNKKRFRIFFTDRCDSLKCQKWRGEKKYGAEKESKAKGEEKPEARVLHATNCYHCVWESKPAHTNHPDRYFCNPIQDLNSNSSFFVFFLFFQNFYPKQRLFLRSHSLLHQLDSRISKRLRISIHKKPQRANKIKKIEFMKSNLSVIIMELTFLIINLKPFKDYICSHLFSSEEYTICSKSSLSLLISNSIIRMILSIIVQCMALALVRSFEFV